MPVDPRLGARERKELCAAAEVVVGTAARRTDGGAPFSVARARRAPRSRSSSTPRARPARPRPVELTFGNVAAGRRRRLGAALGSTRRALALPAAALPRRRADDPRARADPRPTAVVHERFDADRAAAALRDDDVTLVSLVSTMLARMLDAGGRPRPALRCALIGGGPVAAAR